MPNPLPYHRKFDELNEEEKILLEINKKSIADFVEQSSLLSDVNYATRNVHAKTYAVINGEFVVSNALPHELQPFFEEKKFDLVIRFSNAKPVINSSKKEIPAYGFAVKIIDDKGSLIANYPLVNFPLFPVNSVSTFLKLFTSINQFYIKKWSHLPSLAAQMVKVIPSVLNGSFIKSTLHFIGKRNDFFLSFDYYSVGAYRMGDYMIKIKLKPQSVEKNFGKKFTTRKALEEYFSTNDYTADVLIQFCSDIKDQPINTLNTEWKNAPFIKIGEVNIKKNSLPNPRDCSNELLSFNPFENKPFFHPVGKIQKLREEAYKVSMQTRTKINKLLHG
ncbi:catalase [Chryseobacterium soli]|uniref:catalase n=1 Tax=Chryseobacterium soli TaxID=445961 RepID=UPI002952F080|nr:catalase [Chryseobacterium soli]MDV7699004.1 catalase [Chryseobacterium soli]